MHDTTSYSSSFLVFVHIQFLNVQKKWLWCTSNIHVFTHRKHTLDVNGYKTGSRLDGCCNGGYSICLFVVVALWCLGRDMVAYVCTRNVGGEVCRTFFLLLLLLLLLGKTKQNLISFSSQERNNMLGNFFHFLPGHNNDYLSTN